MCNAIAAAVISVAGSVFSGISQMQAAKQQANAARMQSEYQAQALEFNAQQSRGEAEAVSEQGANEQEALARKQRAVIASGRANAGASGMLLDSGSAANAEVGTELQASNDRDLLRENYQRRKFGLVNQAVGYEHQAEGTRKGGEAYASAVENAGRAGMAGSLLSAAGTVAGKWDDMFTKSAGTKGKRVSDWHDGGNSLLGLRWY